MYNDLLIAPSPSLHAIDADDILDYEKIFITLYCFKTISVNCSFGYNNSVRAKTTILCGSSEAAFS